jgi:hypothetical protein
VLPVTSKPKGKPNNQKILFIAAAVGTSDLTYEEWDKEQMRNMEMIWVVKFKRREKLDDPGVDGRKILK